MSSHQKPTFAQVRSPDKVPSSSPGLGGRSRALGKSLLEEGRKRRLLTLTQQVQTLNLGERRVLRDAAEILIRLNDEG